MTERGGYKTYYTKVQYAYMRTLGAKGIGERPGIIIVRIIIMRNGPQSHVVKVTIIEMLLYSTTLLGVCCTCC